MQWTIAPNLAKNISAGASYTNNFITGAGSSAQMVGQIVANTNSVDRMIDVTRYVREQGKYDLSFLIAREVRFLNDSINQESISIVSREGDTNSGPRLIIFRALDSDNDGIGDDAEINVFNTDPNNADTDNDGYTDGDEILVYNTNPGTSPQIAPTITSHPENVIIGVGGTATFTVSAQGTSPLQYQWFFNDTNVLTSATNASFALTNAQLPQAGNYHVVVSNSGGSASSSNALLIVTNINSTGGISFPIYESFSYGAGTELGSQGNWVLNSGTSGVMENGNLPVSGLAEPMGNRFAWTSANMSLRLPIGTNVSGDVFFSLALRIDNLGTFQNIGTMAGFTIGSGTTFGTKLNIQTNGQGGFKLGTSKNSGTTFGGWATNTFSPGEAIFVVGRYRFVGGNGTDDTCDLWVNPPSDTFGAFVLPEPSVEAVGVGGTDLSQVDRFFFRSASSTSGPSRMVADELRIGYTWADVTSPLIVPLEFTKLNNQIKLSWPTNAAGWTLEATGDLTLDDWEPVAEVVTSADGTNSVIVPIGLASAFYRLRR